HKDFELYVIDNSSKDQTLDLLSRYDDPRIHIIANDKNVGVAEGNNQGICRAIADACGFVLLINNDTEFGSDLLATMLDASVAHSAEMLVPKIMYFETPKRIWCAGGYFKPWLGYPTGHSGE